MNEDIRRSVRTSRHDRSAGDAPNIGRVSRTPGTGLPKGIRRRKRKAEGRRSRKRRDRRRVIKTWTFLVAVAAVGLLGVCIWLGIDKIFSERPEGMEPDPVAVAKPLAISQFPSPSDKAAIELVRTALAVRDVARVGQFIRTGKASPEQVVEFFKGMVAGDGEIDRYEWLGSMDANGMALEGVSVTFKTGKNRLALLTPDSRGKWRMDFESFARVVEPAWKEIVENRAKMAVVRVFVAKDSYYNGIFSDEKQWLCYGIASPDTPEILVGYCKTDSPQARAVRWIASKSTGANRATLELQHRPDSEARQFEITRVLSEDWVIREKPFDQDF